MKQILQEKREAFHIHIRRQATNEVLCQKRWHMLAQHKQAAQSLTIPQQIDRLTH
jgi:hypothetical protein